MEHGGRSKCGALSFSCSFRQTFCQIIGTRSIPGFSLSIFLTAMLKCSALGYTHTERQAARQASVASEASDLCNGSGTHLECQGKHHHRLALVTLLLPLPLTLDAPLDAPVDTRCGYAFRTSILFYIFLTVVRGPSVCNSRIIYH